ncbi:MAG: hypothetical protein ACTSRI_11625 [Promethearchaeota archaeon]
MEGEKIDIEDLEAFIDGLKTSFDMLGNVNKLESQGFQSQLAKAISKLRLKKVAKIDPLPELLGHYSPMKLKNYLLDKLKELNQILETGDFGPSRKFKLVMKIAQLRARITSMTIFNENKSSKE